MFGSDKPQHDNLHVATSFNLNYCFGSAKIISKGLSVISSLKSFTIEPVSNSLGSTIFFLNTTFLIPLSKSVLILFGRYFFCHIGQIYVGKSRSNVVFFLTKWALQSNFELDSNWDWCTSFTEVPVALPSVILLFCFWLLNIR